MDAASQTDSMAWDFSRGRNQIGRGKNGLAGSFHGFAGSVVRKHVCGGNSSPSLHARAYHCNRFCFRCLRKNIQPSELLILIIGSKWKEYDGWDCMVLKIIGISCFLLPLPYPMPISARKSGGEWKQTRVLLPQGSVENQMIANSFFVLLPLASDDKGQYFRWLCVFAEAKRQKCENRV